MHTKTYDNMSCPELQALCHDGTPSGYYELREKGNIEYGNFGIEHIR